MSIYSTRSISPRTARGILASELTEIMARIPLASETELEDMMNTHVSGIAVGFQFDNFSVYEGAEE